MGRASVQQTSDARNARHSTTSPPMQRGDDTSSAPNAGSASFAPIADRHMKGNGRQPTAATPGAGPNPMVHRESISKGQPCRSTVDGGREKVAHRAGATEGEFDAWE